MAYKIYADGNYVGTEVLDKEHKDAYEQTEGIALIAKEEK